MRTIYRDGRWRTQSATAYLREKHLEREFAANKKARRTNNEVRKMVEDTEREPEVVRELVGDGGEYFQQVGNRYAVFDPTGMLLTFRATKEEAEACCLEHARTGKVSQ
jgi:hypothetical protein